MGRLGSISVRGAVLALVCVGSAHAGGKNPVAAQALYDEARQLSAAGKFEQACPKFKASYDLDPGGGTLLNLADCYEHQGKTALAWTTFKDALDTARRDGKSERVEYATQHITDLEKKLSKLNVAVPDGAKVTGLTVTLDGTLVDEATYGVALPIDPGQHRLRAEAPGKQPFEKTLEVPSGSPQTLDVSIPALADGGGSGQTTTSGSAQTIDASAPPEKPHGSTARTIGFVTGGVGLVALGVGSYFGLKAYSRWDDREKGCEGGCTPEAKTAGDDASSAATASTIGFGVGAVALGVGLVLILTSPSGTEAPKTAKLGKLDVDVLGGPGQAGLSLGGKW